MAISLVTKFKPYVDEKFSTESKTALMTNQDFDWTGAHTVKVYKVSTANMNDYDRSGAGVEITAEVGGETVTQTVFPSRFGPIQGLNATTEEFTLTKDRAFTFAVDKLDNDETLQAVQAAEALERQLREIVIPEIDKYVYGVLCTNAGTKPEAASLTAANIMDKILDASNTLDNNEVPEEGRVLVVTPDTYQLMKKSADIVMETEIGQDMRLKGVIANLDGALVVKVPANRLPSNFGFMLVHPCACVAPKKLEDYRIHQDPPGISGDLVEGRVCYDAFVLDNKVKAIYYQAVAAAQSAGTTPTAGDNTQGTGDNSQSAGDNTPTADDEDEITFSKAAAADVTLTVTEGTITGLKNGNDAVSSSNYTIADGGGSITIKKEYLSTLSNGEVTFNVLLGESDSEAFTVTIGA